MIGPYNCPGKNFAMMQMRSVIARTVQRYDILIPDRENFDESTFFEGIKDHITMGVPECQVLFKRR